MRVEEYDRRQRFLSPVSQLDPGHHSWQGTVPAFAANDIGGFTKPEMATIQFLKPILSEIQCHHFAAFATVVTPDAEVIVFGKFCGKIIALKSKCFLSSQQIWRKGTYCLDQEITTKFPAIHAVIGRAVTNIEAHHSHIRFHFGGNRGQSARKTPCSKDGCGSGISKGKHGKPRIQDDRRSVRSGGNLTSASLIQQSVRLSETNFAATTMKESRRVDDE